MPCGRLLSMALLAACVSDGGGLGPGISGPDTKLPPFSGTIFIDPDIVTSSDPTTFQVLTDKGQATRTMYDRRPNAFVQYNAYLFDATFSDGFTVEVQVNPEFGSPAFARSAAMKYVGAIGRLPKSLRKDVQTVRRREP
jgi:hypothetical protein